MPNTYTQLIIHIVFAVNNREYLIHDSIRKDIEKYITKIVQNNDHKMLSVYCMPDHCHILVGLNPKQAISDLARIIKNNSSKWINTKKYFLGTFSWQEGYGAFSYSKSHLDTVCKYIMNQNSHHKKISYKKEYMEILERFGVIFDEKYL
jgi:putative transposase